MQGLKPKTADEEKGGFKGRSFQVDRAWFRVGGMNRGEKPERRRQKRVREREREQEERQNRARDRNRRRQKTSLGRKE